MHALPPALKVPPGARCAWHPAAPALDTCARCGAFTCLACVRSAAGLPSCSACTERERATALPPPEDADGTLLLAWTSLVLPPVAPVALALALHHLRKAEGQPGAEVRAARKARWVAGAALVVHGVLWGLLLVALPALRR